MEDIKAIILDIEGTTSSINFVHEILFPYAQKNLHSFIENNLDKKDVKNILEKIKSEHKLTTVQEIIDLLQIFIKEDKKDTCLKDLQGLIWETGYKNKDYFGHIYKDAYEKVLEWYQAGIDLYIYSSGSVKAQQLIFAYSDFGDLNYLFKGNFDTKTGNKKEISSYQNILDQIKFEASNVLFLSDNSDELKAAQALGIKVIKIARPSDGIAPDPLYQSVNDFYKITW